MRSTTCAAAVLVALATYAGLIAGCGGESAADKASSQVCEARNDIAKQLRQLESLTPTTASIDDVTNHVRAIQDDLSTISKAMDDLSDERRKEVRAANDAFTAKLEELGATVGKSLSPGDATTQLEGALKQLAASYRSTFGQLDCS
jgi:methyl-accepting chemotaxis protein